MYMNLQNKVKQNYNRKTKYNIPHYVVQYSITSLKQKIYTFNLYNKNLSISNNSLHH